MFFYNNNNETLNPMRMFNSTDRRLCTFAMCGLLAAFGLQAKNGAPHTVKADVRFNDVNLTWCAPSAEKQLKWHNDYAYNGDSGTGTDKQKATKTYVASKFDATDLKNYVGESVTGIKFYQYRPVFRVTVMVYENGEVVASGVADPAAFAKDKELTVALETPVTIKANSDYLFAICYEAGSNMDFVAMKDQSTDAPGKGDLFSTDGKTWFATGNGDYLITAILANDTDAEPDGYYIYRDDVRLFDAPTKATNFLLDQQIAGDAKFCVSAVYGNEEYKSGPIDVKLIEYATLLPSPTIRSAKVQDLNVSLAWAKPLLGGTELTWTDKSSGQAIGGTASSNTKVWVRNQFDSTDLMAFRGGVITAINYKFAESVMSQVTLYIMKDGVIDYSEDVPADAVSAIVANEWTKFPLTTPYALEDGHDYAYGLYVMHTPKMHPMLCDASEAVNVKGNSFSTSSPSSKGFNQTKPSWKTLTSGGIAGNWAMTADITGCGLGISTPTYDVYRNGQLIASDLKTLSYDDTVDNLGTYLYSIVSRLDNRSSLGAERSVDVKLPAAYAAPLIENATFDATTKEFNLVWNMDKEISHCGDATYMAGFDEEMTLMWGTLFSAAELAAYKGYSISKLKFIIGDEIGDFKIGVYTNKGVALSEVEIPAGTIEPTGMYTITLPQFVPITGEQDLILAYSGTLPAGSSPIIIDKGPLVDGGAKISMTNGANWLNLGTLNGTYGNYNIIISAMASEKYTNDEVPAKTVELGKKTLVKGKAAKVETESVEAVGDKQVKAAANEASKPQVKSFNIYCNGEKVAEVEDYEYTEKMDRFASFTYYVTTNFTNGWESAPSETNSFNNRIAQKTCAPYALTGTKDGNDLQLSWQAPADAKTLTYIPTEEPKMVALRMTGSGSTMTSYIAIKFTATDLANEVGNKVDRIQFGLGDTDVNWLSVIVMYGENIIYEQTVPVSSLIKGVNDIRLNEPVVIPAGTDVCVGYIVNYRNSSTAPVNPLACFESSEYSGFGDLVSGSGSAGYWNSLQTKLKVNYCWWIKAVLAKDDVVLKARKAANAATGISYNIYRDGELVSNVAETSAKLTDAYTGRYHVTALIGDDESAESNAIDYSGLSGIDGIVSEGGLAVTYDSASHTVTVNQAADIEVYSAAGTKVIATRGNAVSLANCVSGVYAVTIKSGDSTRTIKVVR